MHSEQPWLVTGGAGYIGSHVVRALMDARISPVVLDDLSTGLTSLMPEGIPLVGASIMDTDAVYATLVDHGVTGVIHLAAFKYAGVSVKRPLHTYSINVEGTRRLLDAMQRADVSQIVFSSSAAVYGTPLTGLVTESTPRNPESPYGESKLIGEWLISDQARATASWAHPLRHTSLRFFNVVGSGYPELYDASPHNLFPRITADLKAGRDPRIFGDDYATPDGTNVRDYVHVSDVALAHAAAAQRLMAEQPLEAAYNLGSGSGLSVREIMDAFADVTGIPFVPEIAARRDGDPDRIVASGDLASRDLDWQVRHRVTDMVRSSWLAGQRLPTDAAN